MNEYGTLENFYKGRTICKKHFIRSVKVKQKLSNKMVIIRRNEMKNHLKTIKSTLFKNINEFCRNSTLHGLNYLANKDLYPIERAFFALSFITVVIIAGFFINNVYDKWSTTPVIFSINPQPTYITNEPFPALTICNMNQAYKAKVRKYRKNSAEYAIIQMLCKRDVNITVAHGINDWSLLNSFITNISQPCENMLLECRYGSIRYDCNHLFHPIVTDEGLCCGFNMVHPKFMYKKGTYSLIDETSTNQSEVDTAVPWTAEKGYPTNLPKRFYPYKAAGTGESLGLNVILNVEADEYYCSSSNSIGFKMAMHSPTETPNVREVGLLLAAGYETKARVRIDKLESDPMLHRVHLKHRQCLFQDEHNLNYFASYSQHNCETECVANSLLRHCGCVSHFMPKRFGNETVCSIYDVDCVERIRLHSMANDDDSERECDEVCLPSCFDLKYYAEFFTTPLANTGFQIANKIVQNLSSDYIERNIAILTMYYKDNSYRSNKQTEFIGMTDVLSSVGGLIGLFFGFSFISVAEIIFYTFIRPCRKPVPKQKYRSKHLKHISAISTTSSSTINHNFRGKRKSAYNTPIFRISPKVATISSNFSIDNRYLGPKNIPIITPNMKSFKDYSNLPKGDWRYDYGS